MELKLFEEALDVLCLHSQVHLASDELSGEELSAIADMRARLEKTDSVSVPDNDFPIDIKTKLIIVLIHLNGTGLVEVKERNNGQGVECLIELNCY